MFCGDSEDSPRGKYSYWRWWKRKATKKGDKEEETIAQDDPERERKSGNGKGKEKGDKDKKKVKKDEKEKSQSQVLVETPSSPEERPSNIESQAPSTRDLKEEKGESDPSSERVPLSQLDKQSGLPETPRGGRDTATSTPRLLSNIDLKEQETVENRRTSSFVLDLTQEQGNDLLEQLRESAKEQGAIENKTSSLLLDLSQEQETEIRERLGESARNDQDAAAPIPILLSNIDIAEQGIVKTSGVSSILLDLTPQQEKKTLVRFQEAVGEGQSFDLVNDKWASSLMLALTPEQQKEMLERSEFAKDKGMAKLVLPITKEQRTKIVERLREGSEEGQPLELVLPVTTEQRKKIVERMSERAEKGQSFEFFRDKLSSSLLEPLSPELREEILERLEMAAKRREEMLLNITPEQKIELLNYLREVAGESEAPDVAMKSLYSTLLPPLTMEELDHLREVARVGNMKDAATSTSALSSTSNHSDMKNKETSRRSSRVSFLLNENGVESKGAPGETLGLSALLNEYDYEWNREHKEGAAKSTSRLSYPSNESGMKINDAATSTSSLSSPVSENYTYPSSWFRENAGPATFSASRQPTRLKDVDPFVRSMRPSTGVHLPASRAATHPLAPSACCSSRSCQPWPERMCPVSSPAGSNTFSHHISPAQMRRVPNYHYICPSSDSRCVSSYHPPIPRP